MAQGSCSSCSPAATPIYPIVDPLIASPLPTFPTNSAGSVSSSNGTTSIGPGIYTTISVSGKGVVKLNTGVYVITGSISTSGQGVIDGSSGVLLYFACSTFPTPCSAGGQAGASLSLSGKGASTLTSLGGSGKLVIFADRQNTATLDAGGNGVTDTIDGTVYGASAMLSVGGNGIVNVPHGQVVVNSLTVGSSGDWTGPSGTGSGSASCVVVDDSVNGSSGRVVIEAGCAGGSGIIDFNYGN